MLCVGVFAQKYDNRSQVVAQKEKKYWDQLNVACMTDDPDNPAQLVQHKLPWRSQSKFIVCVQL